jgi:hypothetical protein
VQRRHDLNYQGHAWEPLVRELERIWVYLVCHKGTGKWVLAGIFHSMQECARRHRGTRADAAYYGPYIWPAEDTETR